ncbi:hypothetical protein IT774_02645 [Salinimonas marina]|uniref:CARDB domain-containing protein n=1 Tax=Salinimonas marina TaxID=2785918 RepID=A0A7S9HE02_9ALTE|nr:CARDB domain-containing protein [Salinimonas marina]QPG06136.1 hypothetical protein IT774_02645 [Salinimonas marina]
MYAAENERVPGAPFEVSFSHGVNIATGKTITDLSIQQSLGGDLVFDQLTSAVPDNCSLVQPAQGETDGVLHLTCLSATGSASANDIRLSHTGYIGDVLATNSCATLTVTSTSEAQAEYDGTALTPVSASRHITAKHLTVQQSASPSRVKPGDIITITDTIRTTAYGNTSELIVTDTLPDGLEFVNNIGAPADGAPVVSADGKTITHVLLTSPQPSASTAATFSISYQVRVLQTYANGNDVLASDSLGVRSQITYSLAQGATACNDTSAATVSVAPVSTAISIVPDDNGHVKAEYQPGDKVTFRLSMAIPSGDSNAIKFVNYLPLPVFNVANFSTIYDDQSVSSQDKVTWYSADGLPKVAATVDYNIADNALIIDWGDVSGTQAQTLAVDIEATIVSEPFADGLNLTNLFSSTSQNSPGQISSSLRNVSLLVRAPELVALLTDDSATEVDAGDTLRYWLQITNEGGATAYDIAAEVATVVGLDDAVLDSVTIDNVPTSNTTGSFATNDFTVNDPLAPGSIMVVSFTRNVAADVKPQQNITAASSTVWASNTGATKFPALTATQSLFVSSPKVSVAAVSVSPQPEAPDVVVGDLISYIATITLPEGQVSDLVLEAILPAGFEYSVGSAHPATSGYAGSLASAPVVTTAGTLATGQQLTMTFSGTTTTTADNNPDNNSFTVAFNARVTNNEANAAVLAKQDKTLQTAVTFAGFSGPDIDATVGQQFAEHNLSMSTAITPSTALSAGDEITVTLTVENTGTAAAHDVSVTSMLDENLLDTTSVVAGPVMASGYGFNKVGNTVTFTGSTAPLAVGQTLVFSYSGTVVGDVQSGSAFDLTATAQGDSQPGTGALQREQMQSWPVIAQTVNPTVTTLSALTTSESWTAAGELPELAIGEVVTYGVKMVIPEGRTVGKPGQFAIIELPEGLAYIESSATVREISDTGLSSTTHTTLAASNSSIEPTVGMGELAFDLGTVTNTDNDRNNEYIVVAFELLVTNTSANLRGASKAVQASINYLNQAGSAQAHQQSSYSLIVAPLLLMTLDADKTTFSGGEAMTYTLVATNSAQSGASRAWDWVITENLPSRLAYQGLTSATLSRGNQDISACVTQANNEIIVTSSCLTDNRERYLAPGESITIVYTAQADASIGFEEPVESLATFTATSLPGEQGTGNATPGTAGSAHGERTGLPGDNSEAQAVNNLTATGRETIMAGAPAVSLAGSSSALLIGESLTYTMDLGIPTGTTDAFSATLTLPTGVRYTGEPIDVGYPAADFSTSQTPATSQPAGTNPVILQFGSVVNSAGLGQTVQITIPVQTQNILTNQDGVTLTTEAALSYARVSDPAPSDSSSFILREADLEVSQMILSGDVNSDAGDKIRYRTTVQNQSSSAPAHQVVLNDVMPQELLGGNPAAADAVFSNITLTSTGTIELNGTNTAVNQNNVQIITTNHPSDTLALPALTIAANSALVLEYDVYVDDTAQAGQTLLNTVTATYNSLSDISSNAGRDHSDGADDNNNSVLNNYNSLTVSELTLNSALSVQTTLNADKHPVTTFTIGESITLDLRVGLSKAMLMR